jgi:two-component system phosphate regulon response regulator PhoB
LQNFGCAGHGLICCADAEAAVIALDARLPDLLLLEWELPGQSGEALLRHLRAQPRTRALPIIMLTARGAEPDKVLALEAGADDYVTKPFSPRELLARTGAVLRRLAPPASDAIELAGLCVDPGMRRVSVGARQIALGAVEFRLLEFFMRHPERVHSRPQLLDRVWGRHAVLDERTVDAHVGRLRQALLPSGRHGHIQTVRGAGYRFAAGT